MRGTGLLLQEKIQKRFGFSPLVSFVLGHLITFTFCLGFIAYRVNELGHDPNIQLTVTNQALRYTLYGFAILGGLFMFCGIWADIFEVQVMRNPDHPDYERVLKSYKNEDNLRSRALMWFAFGLAILLLSCLFLLS